MRVFPPASLFSPRRPEPLRVFSLSNLFFVLAHVQYRTFSAPNKTTHWGLPSVMGICYPRGYGFNLVRKRVRQVERTQESPGARRKLALTRIYVWPDFRTSISRETESCTSIENSSLEKSEFTKTQRIEHI